MMRQSSKFDISIEGRTHDITAYVHSLPGGEYGPLPGDVQICGTFLGHVADAAVVILQCKFPM